MMINCAVYADGKRQADIAIDELPHVLANSEGFAWIALKDPVPTEILMLQEILDLPELAVEDTLHGGQRSKVEEYDRMLFVTMKVAEQYDGEIHYGDLYIFVNPRFVLSIRNNVRRGFSDVRARAEREVELLQQGPIFVLYALTDAVVDRFIPIVDDLEEQLESVETEIFREQPTREMMLRLHSMKQDVTELRHAVPAVRDELFLRLCTSRGTPTGGDGLQDYFRDVHDHLQRITLSLDGVRDGILMAMQVNMSLIGLEQSEVSKKLAAWAAIFAMMTTLAGIWGIGQRPTGDKDPFALRRHALGVVRILIEGKLTLSLPALLEQAFSVFDKLPAPAVADTEPSDKAAATGKKGRKEAAPQPFMADVPGLSAFVADRLRSYLRDRGFAGTDIEAVLATGLDRLDLLEARLAALAAFRRLPAFESLTAANKRIGNILRKSAGEGAADDKAAVDPALLKEAAERELNDALVKLQPQVQAHLQQQDFTAALQALAALQAPVDAFFEQVMVNAEDPALRRNRLALLGGLHALMNQVADLSQL